MENVENISSKCKNCGSELWYNPKEGCLTCKYCESNYFLPKKAEDAVLVRQYSSAFHPNQFNEAMKAYKCNKCANVYYMSSEEKSKKCPNCGSSSSSMVEDSGACADGIIPFKISKDQAAKCFKDYLRTKSAIPGELKRHAQNQKLMGVFVPVWNFSFTINSAYSANANELKKDYSGMYYSVSKPVFGEKIKRVKSLDQSATNVEDDVFLELFDEDDYAGLIPFIPEYTYGYRVDAINKDIHEYYYDITKKAEESLEAELKKSINSKYKEVFDIQIEAHARDVFFNFAYVPVYVNTFEYQGKIYKTYISGTTGKVVGKTPVSLGQKVKNFFKAVLVLGLAAAIAYFFFNK